MHISTWHILGQQYSIPEMSASFLLFFLNVKVSCLV